MCQPETAPAFPRLIVGLGNPGPRYRLNRHNLGFQVTEALAAAAKAEWNHATASYRATGWDGTDGSCVFLQPLTYMNLSGQAVSDWLARHDLEPRPGRILVVCDDLALPLGTLRLRAKGSSGGQNGLLSIMDHLERDDFPRLRMGIDGTEGTLHPEDWADYVLDDFLAEEKESALAMIARATQAVACWCADGLEKAASRFNGALAE